MEHFFSNCLPICFFFISLLCRQGGKSREDCVLQLRLPALAAHLPNTIQIYFDMPNRRDLKRTIQTICDDVFAECIAISLYEGGVHQEDVESLLTSIIVTRNDFISRISHPEPGMNKKKYFDKLAQDFAERISEIIDHMGNLT